MKRVNEFIGYHKYVRLSEISEGSIRLILGVSKKELAETLNLSKAAESHVTVPVYEESSAPEKAFTSFPDLLTIKEVSRLKFVLCTVLEYIEADSGEAEVARMDYFTGEGFYVFPGSLND